MKKRISPLAGALAILMLLSGNQALANESDPQVVSEIDLNRYAGKWFEIAHSPNFFQRKCIRSTAEYAVISPTSVSVTNVCYKADESISDIEGIAKIVDIKEPAKLKVRFNFFARGDYWIIDLDPEYQWAVVSGPKKKSLFILARSAPMETELQERIIESLKNKGFRTDELIFDQYSSKK